MNPTLEDLMAAREKRKAHEAAMEAAKTGGLGGALLGTTGAIYGGAKSLPKVALGALIGSAGGAAIGGGSQMIGNALMGAPNDGEPGAFGHRGALGGALAGGAGGAALGGLLGSGKLAWLGKIGPIARALEEKEGGPLNNIITDKIRKWMAAGKGAAPRTAAALGLAGGTLGLEHGMDEGAQLDLIHSLQNQDDEDELA